MKGEAIQEPETEVEMQSVRRSWIVAAAVLAGALVAVVVLIATGRIPLGAEPIEATLPAAASSDAGRYVGIDTSEVRAELEAIGLSDVPDNIVATLSTLEKVDGYPVYTMRYFGPYLRASELRAEPESQDETSMRTTDWACSLFAALGNLRRPVFGRNFDWEYSPILVLFLEPEEGYRSVMSVDIAYLVDEEAIGRLDAASVEELLPLLSAPFLTFDGMNEHGVAIGMAAVDYECGYPSDPDRRDVGDLEMMREVLEAAATVDEAIAFLETINPVSQGGPNTHYLIADRTPAAALVEYHDGEMVVFRSSAETPWQLGTNFPVVLTEGNPTGNCWRYDLLEATLREHGGSLTADGAADLLQAVSTPMTRWSIVYDLAELEMRLVIERDTDDVHTFSLEGEAADTWTQTYGSGLDTLAHDVLLLDGGGYLLVGETAVDGEQVGVVHLLLMKLDDDGDVVWEQTYAEERASSGAALLAANDGGYVIAGAIQSDHGGDADIYLLRVDEDGTEQWSRSFGTPWNEFGGRLLESTNGDYVIIGNSVDPSDIVPDPSAAGYAGFAGRSSVYIVRTDEDGNEI